MEKSNNITAKPLQSNACLLDTDVIINWLTQEVESITGKELWKACHQIIKLIEDNKIKGLVSLLHLMEVRFILGRKKSVDTEKIKSDIKRILEIIEIIIPDEIDLLRADGLQIENLLSPCDAVLVSVALSSKEAVVVSRDKTLLSIAAKTLPAFTPEDFLAKFPNQNR
jgi:predicted nucleic acid-binding protein